MVKSNTEEKLTLLGCALEVMETVPLVMRFIRAQMRSQGALDLSVPQFRSLTFLNRHPGASLSDLAEHLGVTRPTASATVERLVQRGLVNRADDPTERRRLVLTLTVDGEDHLQQAREVARSSVAGVLAELPEAKLLQISQGLALLGEAFKEEAGEAGGQRSRGQGGNNTSQRASK